MNNAKCPARDCTVCPHLRNALWNVFYCEVHYPQVVQLQVELPIAVQELHAFALWWAAQSEENRRDLERWPRDADSIFNDLLNARERVDRLRKLESFLKGEDNALNKPGL